MGFSIGSNNANYNNCASWGFPIPNTNITTVGTNGGPSYYGTYDQSGNVKEWNDLNGIASDVRGVRGGSWASPDAVYVSCSGRNLFSTSSESVELGFRIASSTNPLNLSYFLNVVDNSNTADTTGYGSVNYNYKIARYTVTNCEYVDFLNAVAKTDSFGLYNANMSSDNNGGIVRSGTIGSYSYSVKVNMGNKPIIYISWFDIARYCNWLHNGRSFGSQNNNTTEDGAYTLNGIISGNAVAKNNNALYWIPTENEWYKAAYYKGGSTNAGYWAYATQSDTTPVCVTASSTGDGLGNQICNYNSCAVWNGANGNVTTVGSNGLDSYYGAYDMNGNVWEWTDTIVSSSTRVLRGGNYAYNSSYLISTTRNYSSETSASSLMGFRVMSRTNYSGYLDMVLVGDENNYADTNGYGSVWYSYYVGKYPVTNNQYLEFLNSVAVTDTNGLYNTNMGLSNIGGILRSGSNGSYVYTLKSSIWANKPVSFVSWQNAARFCNWLSYGKPTGLQSSSTTELRAYDVSSSIGRLGNNNSLWYYLCSENEWYKAAYYKGGNDNAGYWSYATQSNTAPQCVSSNSTGDGPYDNTQIFSCVLAVPTPTPTTTPTITPTPSLTNTATPSSSLTPTTTPTNTVTSTVTLTNTTTPTNSSTTTSTPTISPTKTSTPTPTRPNSLTPTPTSTVTKTPSNTPTKTSTPNTTTSVTATMTNTPTVSPTKNIYTRYHKTNISNFNNNLNSLNISCADFCMPNNFRAYTINTSAFLSWTTNNDCNNLIKQYDVYYKNINSNIWILHSNLPSTARTVTISNLTSYNSYIFKLSAIKQDNSILGNVCSNITVPGMTPFATRTPTKTPTNTPSSTSPGLSFSATPTPTTTPPICVPGSGNTMILNFENSLYDSGSAGMCMIAYPGLSSVISSDQKKSGNYSAKLSGSEFIYSNPNSFFALGTSNFTIETWLYLLDLPGVATLYDGFNLSNPNSQRSDCFLWQLYSDSYAYPPGNIIYSQNTSYIFYNDTQYWFNSPSGYTIPLNTWVKHSLVRENGHLYWYVNDSIIGSTLVDWWNPIVFDGINQSLPELNITSEYCTIGASRDSGGMDFLHGYLDEFKIIKAQP